ncbi:MAG: hypothetical protein ACRC4W_06975 [Treponemataceae bacterium]
MNKKIILSLMSLLLVAFASFSQDSGTYYTDDTSCMPTKRHRRNMDDDIFISSPQDNEVVSGIFELKVEQPFGNPKVINAFIRMEMPNGRDKIVWKGTLTPENEYATKIDSSKFQSGEYEIKVQYVYQGQKYDEDIEIYVQ